jgi:hypothetical protein
VAEIDNDAARTLINVAKAIGRRQSIRGYVSQYHSAERGSATCRCGALLPCPERTCLDTYLDSLVTEPIAPTTITTSR